MTGGLEKDLERKWDTDRSSLEWEKANREVGHGCIPRDVEGAQEVEEKTKNKSRSSGLVIGGAEVWEGLERELESHIVTPVRLGCRGCCGPKSTDGYSADWGQVKQQCSSGLFPWSKRSV